MLLGGDRECQLDGLALLSNTLMFGDHENLSDFPSGTMAEKLTELLSTADQNDIKELVTQCMRRFLDADPRSTRALSEAGAFEVVGRTLTEFPTYEIGENCVHIIKTVSEFRPLDFGTKVGIRPLIVHMDKLKLIEKRTASTALLGITGMATADMFVDDVDGLLRLCQEPDPTVRSNCLNSLSRILKQVNKDKMDVGVLDSVIKLLNELEDPPCLAELMRGVMNLSTNLKFANVMLPNKINFERIFFGLNLAGNADDIRRSALNIMINLLPDVDLPEGFWILNNRTLERSKDFAREIQPFALRMLFEKSGRETLVMATLAATMLVQPLDITEELLSVLGGLLQSPICAPFVLLVVKTFKDPSPFFKNGFIPMFQKMEVDDKVKEWYADRLAKLIESGGKDAMVDPAAQLKIDSLEQLCSFVMTNELTPFRFQSSGILKRANELLEAATEVSPSLFPAIEKIVQLAHGILMFMPVTKISDPFAMMSPSELLNKSIKSTLKIGSEEITGITIGVDLDFSGLEAWYNTRTGRVNTEMMLAALSESEFKDTLVIANPDSLFPTQRGLIRRNLNIESNVKYHFRIRGKEFSAYDCWFHAIARTIKDPKEFQEVQHIEYLEGECPRAAIVVPIDMQEGILETLRLLEKIHNKIPSINVQSDLFRKQVFLQLSSPVLTMGFFSIASRIIYHFPFMFDIELRQAFFRIIGFDLSYSLPYMNNYFFKEPWNQRTNSMKITCRIRRDHLYEDGIKLLKIAGPGMLRIDAIYQGEEGIGAGPTQEFFYLFSQELLKKDKKIWRDSSIDASDSVFCEQGLFPAPNADPQIFYLIGLLVGKALLMDMITHLTLNPAFCKLMLGRPITLADVDPSLASSLAKSKPEDLAGLTFTYPGYPDVELKPGGAEIEITPENFEEYKALVEKKTIDIPDIIGEFRRALSTIVSWETLNVFSPEEITTLISGQNTTVTREELEAYVEVSHGYTRESPQIGMLFDTILEMTEQERGSLFKFITGSSKLPVGGLKALNPRLTIALRTPERGTPDECLPSVMTCANYFKIPQYTSRDVMKAKLRIAISEGQETFLLS